MTTTELRPNQELDATQSVVDGAADRPVSANPPATPNRSTLVLVDPLLQMSADVLDDLESVHIANENRLRQLTRTEPDKDGELRGFGLDTDHRDVRRLADLVDALAAAEHQAELQLKRTLRRSPLNGWISRQCGIGEKQAARLLAAIGDPYLRTHVHDDGTHSQTPRTVSQLWAYCGLDPVDGVTRRRTRGVKANWNATAKKRIWLIADKCIMQPETAYYRQVYVAARAQYADAVHDRPCVQCGPSGKPAETGSPLSNGHQHARARRRVAKEILKDLWREAKRLHGDTE